MNRTATGFSRDCLRLAKSISAFDSSHLRFWLQPMALPQPLSFFCLGIFIVA
jgi:hypothetical protein